MKKLIGLINVKGKTSEEVAAETKKLLGGYIDESREGPGESNLDNEDELLYAKHHKQ